MYLEVSGVSKHELGGTREKLKIKAREHDARYGMNISRPVQNMFISTRKYGINLKLRGGIRDETQHITANY